MSRFAVVICALVIALPLFAEPPKVDQVGDPLPGGALARLGTARWRVGGGAHLMQYLADGTLLTVSDNLVIQIWDAKTGKERRFFDIRDSVPDVPASLRWLAMSTAFSKPIALSDDGKRLAVITPDAQVHLIDATNGKHLRKIGLTGSAGSAIALSSDGSRLAEMMVGRPINRNTTLGAVWDTKTGERVKVLSGQGNTASFYYPLQMLFSSDGKTLLQQGYEYGPNGNPDRVARAYDLARDAEPRRIDLGPIEPGITFVVTFSPDRKMIAVPSVDSVRLLNVDDRKEIVRFKNPADPASGQYVFTPDGKALVNTVGPGAALVMWEIPSGKVIRKIDATNPVTAFGTVMTISPDAKTLVACNGPLISLVDLETGKVRNETVGHAGALREALFSADGREIMTRSTDGLILRWDPATGKEIGRWEVPTHPSSCQITPDQKWILANVAAANVASIAVHDPTSMKELRRIDPGAMSSWGVVPDSKHVCFTSRQANSVVLHDIATGEKRFEARLPSMPGGDLNIRNGAISRMSAGGASYNREAFSRDGRLLGVVSPGFITVWNVSDGRQIGQIPRAGLGIVRSIDLPTDGGTVGVDSAAGVAIWELATATRRLTLLPGKKADPDDVWLVSTLMFPGAMHFPSALAFSPDGRLLARAGDDRVIRVWDIWSGEELGQFTGHRGAIVTLTFSPEGRRLVTTSTDSTALVWDAGPMCDKLPRSWSSIGDSADALWAILIDADAAKAFEAMRTLAGDPAAGINALRRVKRSEPVDPNLIEKLVGDLNASKFATRDKARIELEHLGEQAAPALRRIAANPSSAETRQAARRLLERLSPLKLTPEQVRTIRAVEVLECIGTPGAVDVLKSLATGADEVAPTPQARAALARLNKK
jgi:WD40 repeat protein